MSPLETICFKYQNRFSENNIKKKRAQRALFAHLSVNISNYNQLLQQFNAT